MAADPVLPDESQVHDPDSVAIVNLLTTRLAAVFPDQKDHRNIVKIVTKLTSRLDADMRQFVDLMLNMMREELNQEIADLTEEEKIQVEEFHVTSEAVKTCTSIVSKVKRLRDLRQAADASSSTKRALEQEDEVVSRASEELAEVDVEKLRGVLEDANSLVRSYNDLIRQSD